MGAAALLDQLRELLGTHPDSGSRLLLPLSTAAVGLLALLLWTRAGRSRKEGEGNGSGGRIRRAMSFTSAACAQGAVRSLLLVGPCRRFPFLDPTTPNIHDDIAHHAGPMPPHAGMHPVDPIINAVVVLASAPTREEVLAAIQPLFYFER